MSLTIHTVIIAGAVYATLNAGQTDNSVKVDTTVVYLQQQQQKPPEQQPVQLDIPLKGFQTVVAPDVVPTNRSEEHTSELQSQSNLVCRLLLEKKKQHRQAYVRGHRLATTGGT